jgi:hypothetical protein
MMFNSFVVVYIPVAPDPGSESGYLGSESGYLGSESELGSDIASELGSRGESYGLKH